MKALTRFQTELFREYKRAQKQLRIRLKHKLAPEAVKAIIKDCIKELTARHAIIIARYIYKLYKKGTADAKREGVTIEAAAPNMGKAGVDLSEVSQKQMNRIFHSHLGKIGDYNINLSKSLQHQYNVLLSDNKLIKSLDTHGWSPWLDKALEKRGIDPKVIALVKGQKTSKQMINILNWQGIHGGKHPNEVAKMLVPHINRFFGPEGVSIDNIGKTVKRFAVDADGNYGWFDHKITQKYKATPRTYSRVMARDVMRRARMDAYYDSLQKSKFVDHYISVAHMDSTTCGMCASMHGRTVTKGSGPIYHSNCGCDLKPVWKKDSPLASQNKPEAFYSKQCNMHFLRTNDLKNYNAKMPRGMKLKYPSQLPEDAITYIMPGKTEMRAIRHELLGKPAKITPVKAPQMTSFSDDALQMHAQRIYAKSESKGVEFMHIYTTDGAMREFAGTKHGVEFVSPVKSHSTIHTHPTWDSPLSYVDIYGFLSRKPEFQMCAVSKENIYLMTKTKGTKTLRTAAQKQAFRADFDLDVKNYLEGIDAWKYSHEDYREAYLYAGRAASKKYDINYRVVPRP